MKGLSPVGTDLRFALPGNWAVGSVQIDRYTAAGPPIACIWWSQQGTKYALPSYSVHLDRVTMQWELSTSSWQGLWVGGLPA